MSDKKNVAIYFGKEHSVTIKSEDPERLVQELTETNTGWANIDEYTINRSNITYIRIYNTPKVKSISF